MVTQDELSAMNPMDIPIVDTDFWLWLTTHYTDYRYVAIRGYLRMMTGTTKAQDTRLVETLMLIYDHYAFMLFRDFKFGTSGSIDRDEYL